ncbi:uncharacterized protein LOC124457103 [Xenia sp. Carnegie-2017]|uniref:uncharacterized protein LOC124457103 n=1 Tax=Xenia sp. Carnegie-2017 TaxID=2897299 RepID=UPI001F04D45D|nr:uncharacterized protein LOC124457103 [Xenia sp. Carnegie-2017]
MLLFRLQFRKRMNELNELKSLNELKLRLNEEYCGATKMSREEFLSLLLKDETSLRREFSAEIYIPKIVRKQHEDKGNVCMALRSEVSGNCLYSSVSLLLAVFFPSKTKRTISGPTCPVPSKKAKAEKTYKVRAGDQTLENHLLKCGKNKSYISKTSQNKIINCIDEAADSSHKEQLSLVLRFVDSSMNVKEEFMCFLHCKWGLSGQHFSKLILETLEKFALPIMDCRGQGYDGAGAVSGHINGLAAHILRTNPKALYTHCYSHRLNLSVCDTLSNVEINNMLSVVSQAANFIIISQTRNIPFAEHVKKSDVQTKKAKLGKTIDVMDGFHLITTLKNDVANMRKSINFYHNTWYEEALKLAEEVNVQETKERIAERQTMRSNPPSHSFKEHYILTITIPLLDHLKHVTFPGFENIKVILRILGTLPITSCECERSISALRNLKTYQRSTMVEERLNGLALMRIHPEIIPDIERVINKFAEGNTRLKFA